MKKNLLFMVVFLLIIQGVLLSAEDERVDCVCSAGFNNTVKLNYWHHLTVTLTNFYLEKVDVLVKVSRKHQSEPELILQQILTIPEQKQGETLPYKLVFICPPFRESSESEYIIEVLDKNNNSTLLKESYWVKIIRNEKEYQVKKWREKINIILNPNVLENYEEQILINNTGLELPFFSKMFIRENQKINNITCTDILLEDVPSNWLALDSIKFIVLCNPEVNKIKLFNREKAIENWVRSGGILLLILSEKYLEYKNLGLVKLAGLNLKGSITVQSITEKLSGYPDKTIKLPGNINSINTEIIAGTKNVFPLFLGAELKNPVITSTWLDAGIITCFLFDIRGLQASDFNESFQKFMLDKFLLPYKNYAIEEGNERDKYPYDSYSTPKNTDIHKNLGTIINDIQKAKPMSFEIIAIFICVYMFVIAFFDYLLLKVLSRLHWTWLSVIIWVIAFVVAADYLGESVRGGEMNLREIAVIDSGNNFESAKISQFAGVFSQQNLSYTVFHDNDDCGLTRLERLSVGDEWDEWNSGYYSRYNRSDENIALQRSVELDKSSNFSVYQPADISERKHKGEYLKSVILPKWAIRDIQAKSLQKEDVSKGLQLKIEENVNQETLALFSEKAVITRYTPDKIITVTNNYTFSVGGFIIIYGLGKTFYNDEELAPGGMKKIYFFSDYLLLADPKISKKEQFQSSEMTLKSIFNSSEFNYKLDSLRAGDSLDLIIGNKNLKASPEFCSLFFASFTNTFMAHMNNNDKSSDSPYFTNHSYSSLDVSHRLTMGDTIIISWTDGFEQNSSDFGSLSSFGVPENLENGIDAKTYFKKMQGKDVENSVADTKFPSIRFENWQPLVERYIFIREFLPPLNLLVSEE